MHVTSKSPSTKRNMLLGYSHHAQKMLMHLHNVGHCLRASWAIAQHHICKRYLLLRGNFRSSKPVICCFSPLAFLQRIFFPIRPFCNRSAQFPCTGQANTKSRATRGSPRQPTKVQGGQSKFGRRQASCRMLTGHDPSRAMFWS